MQRVIVDAGPLIGWFNLDDEYHELSRSFLNAFDGELLTTWPVISEVCWMLPQRLIAPFLRWIGLGGVTVVDLPPAALGGLADRIEKYAGLPMELADATLIWLAESLDVLQIATIDRRDFGVYRTARGAALINVLYEPAQPAPKPARKRTTKR